MNQKQKLKLREIIEQGADLFMRKRYENTQMLDVAQKMGVSVGTLYLYVKSKKALFDLALQEIFRDFAFKETLELPVAEIDHDFLMEHIVGVCIRRHMSDIKAIISKGKDRLSEVEEIIRLMYGFQATYRKGILMLERNGVSWPKLADFFFNSRAHYVRQIADYLEQGITQGITRPLQNPLLSARLILECIAWFAMHRHNDRDLSGLDDKQAEDTVVDALVHAFRTE